VGLGVRQLSIIDSDFQRAHSLADRMPTAAGSTIEVETDVVPALENADGIVNTTPVGMAKYPGLPFPVELLQPRHWVADIVYFPTETELLRRARSLGCRTLDGTGMAIGQAARAFELFTGRIADRHAMAKHFEAAA
jgi:shikimate dehydrogenase